MRRLLAFPIVVLVVISLMSCGENPLTPPTPAPSRTATAVPAPPTVVPPAPAATATPIPVPPTQQPPAAQPPSASSGVCRLDKVATFAEVNSGGPQRIEAGGGGSQHIDFYPNRGVKAVSYILAPQRPAIWFGFGSIWEAPNSSECSTFDWVKDASDYARGRLNGHSGLVVDMRTGSPKVIANVASLGQSDVDSLLALHRASQSGQPSTSAGSAVQPTQGAVSCTEGVREDHDPVVNQPWTPKGEFRVVNFWSNQPGVNQQERKLLLKSGENPNLLGGGTSWSWSSTCESIVQGEFVKNTLPSVTLDQLRAEGLVR